MLCIAFLFRRIRWIWASLQLELRRRVLLPLLAGWAVSLDAGGLGILLWPEEGDNWVDEPVPQHRA